MRARTGHVLARSFIRKPSPFIGHCKTLRIQNVSAVKSSLNLHLKCLISRGANAISEAPTFRCHGGMFCMVTRIILGRLFGDVSVPSGIQLAVFSMSYNILLSLLIYRRICKQNIK